MILLITVTGGLHLDGIADTADGLFSYRSRERMLEIMRDSTLGANGVIALVLTILLKYILLHNIPAAGGRAGRADDAGAWPGGPDLAFGGGPLCPRGAGIGDYVNQTGLAQATAATLVSLLLVTGILISLGGAAVAGSPGGPHSPSAADPPGGAVCRLSQVAAGRHHRRYHRRKY